MTAKVLKEGLYDGMTEDLLVILSLTIKVCKTAMTEGDASFLELVVSGDIVGMTAQEASPPEVVSMAQVFLRDNHDRLTALGVNFDHDRALQEAHRILEEYNATGP